MPNETTPDDDVKILPPDHALLKKLEGADLNQLLSIKVVEAAQGVISQASDQFLDECLSHFAELQKAQKTLETDATKVQAELGKMVAASFALKSKAGLGGYDLISAIAKSLHQRCELLVGKSPTTTSLSLIRWHIDSMGQLLAMKVKGTGGNAGAAIQAELDKIAATKN